MPCLRVRFEMKCLRYKNQPVVAEDVSVLSLAPDEDTEVLHYDRNVVFTAGMIVSATGMGHGRCGSQG